MCRFVRCCVCVSAAIVSLAGSSLLLPDVSGAKADFGHGTPISVLNPFGLLSPQPAPIAPVVRARSASTSTNCLPASLRHALADVRQRFGPVEVVSTSRPGARIAGTRHRSLHATCQAVDFRPARGTYAAVAAHLRRSWQGGVGTYSSGHIHIDTGVNYQWHHGAARGSVRSARR
jgi:hypothetical protein